MAGSKVTTSTPPEGALRASAQNAHCNGISLLEDARVLLESKRYARATALAILAEEEFLKAFVLDNASLQGRWDATLYSSLSMHGIKLGLAEGLRETVRLLAPEPRLGAHAHGRAADYGVRLPSEEQMDAIAARVRTLSVKNRRNYLKQNAFYVGVGPDGVSTSTPEYISEIDALACLSSAEEMAAAAGRQAMAYPAVAGEQWGRRQLTPNNGTNNGDGGN